MITKHSRMITFICLANFALGDASAREGGTGTHGGGTIVCKNAAFGDNNDDVKPIDIYNAELITRAGGSPLTFKATYRDESEVIEMVRQRLLELGSRNYLFYFDQELKKVEDSWILLPSGHAPFPANDAILAARPPKNCQISIS